MGHPVCVNPDGVSKKLTLKIICPPVYMSYLKVGRGPSWDCLVMAMGAALAVALASTTWATWADSWATLPYSAYNSLL